MSLNNTIKPWEIHPVSIEAFTEAQFPLIKRLGSLVDDSIHMVDGALTEIVEMKQGLFIGDEANIIEELGDVLFYVAGFCKLHNIDLYRARSSYREDTMQLSTVYINLTIRNLIQIADLNKGVKVYNREFDQEKLIVLISTVYDLILRFADTLDLSVDEALWKNHAKLQIRYKGGYSDDSANNRDLDSEREILES